MQIEFLIDQEGFRTAQPIFNFVGYIRRDYLDKEVNYAQFRPLTRKIYQFHYAPFDGLPLLRRLTVNGDDSRDYISRQAHLTLKDNGVYTVYGTEVLSASMAIINGLDSSASEDLEAAKLSWQFDYVIDDRFPGKTTIGEKTLTPLTFSCSPELLHPLQGKKISIMHIVKKGVASKLVAEKLEPSSRELLLSKMQRSGWQAPLLPLRSLKTNVQIATHHCIAKSHAWNFHRRVQSQGIRQGLDKASSDANVDRDGLPNENDRQYWKEPIIVSTTHRRSLQRHRRALSVNEHKHQSSDT